MAARTDPDLLRCSAPGPRVAAIVLNWNGFDDTCAAIDSLLRQTLPPCALHVVDNASAGDDARRLCERYGDLIVLHRNDTNLGFTGGHNRVLAALVADSAADYVALLNNDAVADPGWLAAMVAAGEANGAGALASLMVFQNAPETVENAGIVVLRSGEAVPRGRGRPAACYRRPVDVLGACGGAVVYRTAALRQVGLFRDDFFLNFEDVDLSLRLVAAGWRCCFVPDAIVRHGLGRSIDKVRDEVFAVRSIRNMDFAYLINMPGPVLVASLPWLFCSWLLAPLACLLLLQVGYARVLWRGHWRTIRSWRDVLAARRRLGPLRKASSVRIFFRLGSSLLAYGRFLRDVVLLRRRAAFR